MTSSPAPDHLVDVTAHADTIDTLVRSLRGDQTPPAEFAGVHGVHTDMGGTAGVVLSGPEHDGPAGPDGYRQSDRIAHIAFALVALSERSTNVTERVDDVYRTRYVTNSRTDMAYATIVNLTGDAARPVVVVTSNGDLTATCGVDPDTARSTILPLLPQDDGASVLTMLLAHHPDPARSQIVADGIDLFVVDLTLLDDRPVSDAEFVAAIAAASVNLNHGTLDPTQTTWLREHRDHLTRARSAHAAVYEPPRPSQDPRLVDCPDCGGSRDDCGVCWGDGYVRGPAYTATNDTMFVDHSSSRHHCARCQPGRISPLG